jgi:Flp pilus assembly protein TadB
MLLEIMEGKMEIPNDNDANKEKNEETKVQSTDNQTELAKAQVEIAKIQSETNSGWQNVVIRLAELWESHDAKKAGRENHYTVTLTMSILIFLAIIIGTLTWLTLSGTINGDSLVFFLGTLSGSVIMLVAERIKSQK